MKIPYSEVELRIALATLAQDEQRLRRMNETVEKLKKRKTKIWDPKIKNKREFNKKTAEFHGIALKTLMHSKNYKTLCDEYYTHLYEKMAKKIMQVFTFTHKEVWALIAEREGFLN